MALRDIFFRFSDMTYQTFTMELFLQKCNGLLTITEIKLHHTRYFCFCIVNLEHIPESYWELRQNIYGGRSCFEKIVKG